MSNIAVLESDILSTRPHFLAVKSKLSFEKEVGFAIQLLESNSFLASTAMANRQSLIDAINNVASIGISLNPAKKQAHLVPRKNKVYLDVSYIGLIDIAVDTGSVMWAQAEVVYSNDTFIVEAIDKQPIHKRNPFAKDRGEIVGVYVVAKTCDGDYLTTTMSKDEVDSIMNRSESVKSGRSSPWKTDYGEMAKKTVIKRAQKLWPKRDRLSNAIHYLNTDGEEGLSSSGLSCSPEIDDAINSINEAKTIDELQTVFATVWKKYPQHRQALVAVKDKKKSDLMTQDADFVDSKSD